ncbi:ATP synthase complex assembly protein atp12 [Imshaugia aleurites]|uniref:ATP synthase complex assembly protein atp12 n=1 Tax=Imshaugia aleurites TaxID=172621 RepID=A0A8H3FP31_9LECA|nr:ATP synthase complex assembly protein atp12 [Imshaugia aleurites]
MKRIAPLPSSPFFHTPYRNVPSSRPRALLQCLHTTSPRVATPLPITATGPPPAAPQPAASQYGERVDRRRRQAELLKRGQDMRASHMKPGTAAKKRFWKDVSVQTDDEKNHLVNLDTRALRNPTTKQPLTIPRSKPHLATALALEWDLLVSVQQATRSHLIPLTSISARAHVLGLEDGENQHAASSGTGTRYDIVNTLLRYLDTDTLLCWAPAPTPANPSDKDGRGESLRDLQVRTAKPILSYLTQNVWPGVELKPTLDDGSILPASQPAATRAVIKGWMAGLPAWELVGLERAVLASKSLCIAARLVCEWSEYLNLGYTKEEAAGRFGIEEAAKACSQEVIWQTGRWGEVEDSHDVDKEDLRRQFGSVILVVSGTGNRTRP